MPDRDENMIAALKRERATYVARGDDDRVQQVDESLKHFGYEGEQNAVVDPAGGPAGRTAKSGRQRTATSDGGKTDSAKNLAPDSKPGQAGK